MSALEAWAWMNAWWNADGREIAARVMRARATR